jgi:hypothetical protein
MSEIVNTRNAEDAIRARAYELWESEGRPLGREFDHWRRSELETGLRAAVVEAEPKAARKPRAKSKSKKAPREATSAPMAEI